MNIIHTLEPSFPSSKAFIDLGILDTRIDIRNLKYKKIQTVTYDSDHRALMIQITMPGNASPPIK